MATRATVLKQLAAVQTALTAAVKEAEGIVDPVTVPPVVVPPVVVPPVVTPPASSTPKVGDVISGHKIDYVKTFDQAQTLSPGRGDAEGWSCYDSSGAAKDQISSKPAPSVWRKDHVTIDGKGTAKILADLALGYPTSGAIANDGKLKRTFALYQVRFRVSPGVGVGWAILLWATSGDYLKEGEMDLLEGGTQEGDRQSAAFNLHHKGAWKTTTHQEIKADFTQWHTLTAVWAKTKLEAALDGKVFKTVTDPSIIPDKPTFFAIQTEGSPITEQWNAAMPKGTSSVLEVDYVAVGAAV